ncbi:MAG TPA: TonB-dependent receptor, partial [Candidatus Binatia bacterium]|nr:TonB-dependent receptor [Candidatus Binatia bacterium]
RFVTHIANQAVPEYGELDLRLAWQPLATLEFSIVGQNLLHDHHPEFGTVSMPTRQEAERGVYGKVLWRF